WPGGAGHRDPRRRAPRHARSAPCTGHRGAHVAGRLGPLETRDPRLTQGSGGSGAGSLDLSAYGGDDLGGEELSGGSIVGGQDEAAGAVGQCGVGELVHPLLRRAVEEPPARGAELPTDVEETTYVAGVPPGGLGAFV